MSDESSGGRVRLSEGWFLMSTRDLELELARWRDPEHPPEDSSARKLSVEEALAYRDAGNLPDDHGRTLRLVLHVESAADLTYLQSKRVLFEPDFHDAPDWRREGSKPVNVVPLRAASVEGTLADAWWDDPELQALEEEWSRTGNVAGIRVPGAYRGFVYKTALALKAAGREVTIDSIVSSVSRWLPSEEVDRLAGALRAEERS